MKLRAVELFAGIGGFHLACDSLGIYTIWANDIDEKACIVYESRFGAGSIVKGDIKVLTKEVPSHDLLTAGFPCQPFSSAGKKLGIKDPRGTLFEEIVKVVELHKPKYFVLENVKRLLSMEEGQHFATILHSLSSLGYLVEWRVLNAVNFGLPQNRERIFIVGTKPGLLTGASHLLSKEDAKTIPNQVAAKINDKSKWKKITEHNSYFHNWGIAHNGHFVAHDVDLFSEAVPKKVLKDTLQEDVDKIFDFTEGTVERLKNSKRINKYVNGVELVYNQGGGARMGYTIFGINGIAPTLTSSTSRHYERYQISNRFRKLTNVEYARLQGFSDDHCKLAPIYDQYVLYGNAAPPPMVKWVISKVIKGKQVRIECKEIQKELF